MTFDAFCVCLVLPIILLCMLWWYCRPNEIETFNPRKRIRVEQDAGRYQFSRAMPLQRRPLEPEEDLHAIFFQILEDDAALRREFTLQDQSISHTASNWKELSVTRGGKTVNFNWLECSDVEQNIERDGRVYPPQEADLDDPYWIEYWFHGTDYNSAISILEKGILLEKGIIKQDFSHGDGFYVNPSFSGAKMWACIKTKQKMNRPAVIVFKLKEGLGQSGSILNVSQDYDTWEALIKHNREERKCHLKEEINKKVSQHDCIYGPMYNRKWSNNRGGFDNPYRQLCIRKKALAEQFSQISSINGLILYPTGSWNP